MDERKNTATMSPPGGGPGGQRAASGEKPKNFKKTLTDLYAYCKPYLPAILVALVLAVAASVLTIVGPSQLSKITDLITAGLAGGIDLSAIGSICLLLVGIYGLSFVFNYVQGVIMATTTQRLARQMRSEISQKINRLPLKYFDNTSIGDVLSRVTNDVDTIGQTLNQSSVSLVSAACMLVGTLVMMLITNVAMTMAAVVATAIGFGLMMLIMSKSQRYFLRQQSELGEINGHIEEIYTGHSVVQAYNAERDAKSTFADINGRLRESNMKSQFLSGIMMPLMGFIGNFGYVAVCVVGAVLAMSGSITFGVIVAFMVYVRLFTQPLQQLAQAATNLQSTAAASERVFEFLDEKELEDESEKNTALANVKGEVAFENVRFGYDDDNIIIKDFSAKAKPGQKIAIVGPTGAGKTTMVNLLMRFYELNSGRITIDGVPIESMTRQQVHEMFCMVLQDTWLFNGTIRENIVYCKEGVSEEDVIKACRAVGLHHFIRSLPEGYDTVLDDKANLSQGQKQLITIARAMVENAPMLILDEATSSVDTRTEELIQKAMDTLMEGRTSFIIAHRLSTIRNADLILVMRDGDIIEHGTHMELLAKKGFYADLYNSQFEKAS